jgi:hypothetical protein
MNATYRIGVSGFRKRQCTPCQRDWLVLRAGFGKDENIKNIVCSLLSDFYVIK